MKHYYDPRYTGDNLELWQRTYNLVGSKVARLSQIAYAEANMKPDGTWRKKHVPYTLPEEVTVMVDMLGELMRLGEDVTCERCEEMVAYATAPGINQAIYGSTL